MTQSGSRQPLPDRNYRARSTTYNLIDGALLSTELALSPPARLFTKVNAESVLGDDLVHQVRVGGMEPAAAGIAEQPFQLKRLEHAGATGEIHRDIDDLPAGLDAVVFRGNDLWYQQVLPPPPPEPPSPPVPSPSPVLPQSSPPNQSAVSLI